MIHTRGTESAEEIRTSPQSMVGSFLLLAITVANVVARAQTLPSEPVPTGAAGPRLNLRGGGGWLLSPYRSPRVQPSQSLNSSLVGGLIHDGTMALTLQDAISLAIQNNFDVELQRYNHLFAQTELLRSKGGGQLRGVPTTVSELPAGEGGPGEPLLTTVGGYSPVLQLPSGAADLATISGTQTDLSILSPAPYSSGSTIPGFDPSIAAQMTLAQTYYPQSTSFSTGSNYYSSHSVSGDIVYSQGFSTGMVFKTTFSANRLNEASTRLNINPFITGALNVSVAQPLLQGFGIHVNRRFIEIAKNEGRIAQAVFLQQLISTISDTMRLYLDLVSLQQDLLVKQESLQASERLYQDTKNEVELGTQAPIDLTSALAQVASNRQAYINAQGMVLQQELLLKEVLTRKGIADPLLAAASIRAVTPIESPSPEEGESLQTLLEDAIKQRPDLVLAEEQEKNSQEVLKGSRSALLPELNLVASMQNNGGAGSLNPNLGSTGGVTSPSPPANLLGGYGSAVSQIFNRDFPDYTVGFQFNIPFRNRIAKADAARDQLQFQQSRVQIEKLHSQVRLQVGNAFIAVQQARESYKSAMEARTLQAQALDVERAKFEAGVATAYELMQYQSSSAQAKSAAVTALGVYAKARIALQRAVGSTLVDNNVVVEDAYRNTNATPRGGR